MSEDLLDLQLEGGWGRVFRFIDHLQTFAYLYSEEAMDETAQKITRDVRWGLEGQTFDHIPLNPGYLEWKNQVGLDNRILVATQTYIKSIEQPKKQAKRRTPGLDEPPNEQTWEVGPPDVFHQPSGMNTRDLALLHEFGSHRLNIPPRPHWTPVYQKHVSADQFGRRMKNVGVQTLRRLRTFAGARR